MGQLRDRMTEDLKLRKLSPSTNKVYLLYARKLAKHYGRSPAELGDRRSHDLRRTSASPTGNHPTTRARSGDR